MKTPSFRPEKTSLQEKLSAYSQMGKAFLAAAPAGFLAVAPLSTQATIIYHDIPDVTMSVGPVYHGGTDSWRAMFVDLDGVNVATGTFWSLISTQSNADMMISIAADVYTPPNPAILGLGGNAWAFNSYLANGSQKGFIYSPVPYGSPIGPSQSFNPYQKMNRNWSGITTGGSNYYLGQDGGWSPVPVTGYLGVRFPINGNIYYGWVQIQLNTSVPPAAASLTIMDFAYESSANTPIAAGVTSSPDVPTMGQWGLIIWILSLLTFGTLYIKQRRAEPALEEATSDDDNF